MPKYFIAATLIALTFAASSALERTPARAQASGSESFREIEIVVAGGYQPNRIEIRAGERVRLKLVRKEHNACTREVVFPTLDIRRDLPPHEAVFVELPPLEPGEYELKCGMNMIRGTLVVTAPAVSSSAD